MPRKPIKFNLDFMRKYIFSRFTVKQFDDVTFAITPKMDNEPYNVDNMTGVIYVGVNGEMFKQDTNITVSSNSIVVTLDKNMLNKDGRVYAEIELTDSIGTVTSSSFIFDIDRKIGEGANIPGQIDGFVAKYEKLTTEFKQQFQDSLNDVDNRFNILTSSQQQDSEVILARKGETSLKVKIDKIDEQFISMISDMKEVTFLDSFETNPYTISGDAQNTSSFTNATEGFISNKVLNFSSGDDNRGNVISISDIDLNSINDYDCEFSIEYKITGSNPLYVYTGFVDENNQVIESSWDYKTLSSATREIFTFVKHIPLNAKKIRVMYATMSQTSFILGDIKIKKKGILHINGDIVNKEKTIITKVVASWGDFTTIASAIAWAESNINDNTIINIDIVENTYNECNLTITKDNINLVARSKNVIINADGTTTPNTPQANRHGLMSQTTCHHKNLTIIAHATRYAVHNDGGNPYNAVFENCHFIYKDQDSSYGNPVGLGGLANQTLHFKDCTFEIQGNITKNIEYGMIWHNTTSNAPKTTIVLENCNFINCGYMHIFDCGSNSIDSVNIINCKTNSKNKGLLINAISVSTPYTVEINTNGTDIPMIEHTENRLKHYHLIGYDEKVKGNGISLGYAVAYDFPNIGLSESSVKLCTNKNEFYGVATSDINGYGYVVSKGKCAFVYALSNNYIKGDMLKINSLGQFEKTTLIDECVARVTDNYNLVENGLISALI